MKGIPAVYLGRLVSKENFRAFVYAPGGSKKLVESWDEFEKHMETGLWFATKVDALCRVPVEKPKRTRKEMPVIKEEATSVDDFLPIT